MVVNVLFAAGRQRWAEYEAPLREAIAAVGVAAHVATEIAPEDVDYIVYAPNSKLQDFTPYTNTKAVLNLWAGVEAVVDNPTLKVPLARMVDPALTQGMVEWVTGHVLRHHLGMDRHIHAQPGDWVHAHTPLSWDRKLGIMGMGELATASAQMLSRIGFNVTGWSRSAKEIEGETTAHGARGLRDVLTGSEILVLLLPDTPATENILNADTLALLPRGAVILNPGRGALIDDGALLSALDAVQIGHATLDTFRLEPLPADHPYWRHSMVTVTPHIASETRSDYASKTIAENISRGESGLPFVNLVDRDRGY